MSENFLWFCYFFGFIAMFPLAYRDVTSTPGVMNDQWSRPVMFLAAISLCMFWPIVVPIVIAWKLIEPQLIKLENWRKDEA